MNKLEYLKKQREMAYHNLMCYSGNLSMTKARPGFEADWQKSKEECLIVEELIAEAEGKVNSLGAAVIDGKVVHNWEQVMEAVAKVAAI